MPRNDGELKELEVIYALNNRKIKDLTNNMRTLMRNLYGVLDDEFVVKCYKVDNENKTDFVIEYNNIKKNISMKSGQAKIFHGEKFEYFINFLKEKGISQKTIDTIGMFQFGDGTADGSNKENRQRYQNLALDLANRIKEANKELNADMDFVIATMDRCMFKGSYEHLIPAEYIYYGTAEYGVLASRNQFLKSLKRRGFDYYDHLHIGNLFLRPDARYVGRNITSEKKRNRIIAYWPNFRDDIEFISKRYNW